MVRIALALALTLGLLILISGCVPSQYHKSISVRKDASGNIIETIETESVTQQGHGNELIFEHLKGIQPNSGQPTDESDDY